VKAVGVAYWNNDSHVTIPYVLRVIVDSNAVGKCFFYKKLPVEMCVGRLCTMQ
jgi:hypothetical protein